jgi:hypothetical protein|tara:strand:+ start:1310 stop:1735 length:426 start_codon:yes stop_codon:yes gene_type:complete
MKKLILSVALIVGTIVSMNAQNVKGDWYVGTGDIADVAWTEWAISPMLGYGVTDKLMVGLSLAQADSSEDLSMDLNARYFMNAGGQDFFLYASLTDFDTDNLSLGLGKMFTVHKGVFVEPKVVYHSGEKTTNMMLGFGLKF